MFSIERFDDIWAHEIDSPCNQQQGPDPLESLPDNKDPEMWHIEINLQTGRMDLIVPKQNSK